MGGRLTIDLTLPGHARRCEVTQAGRAAAVVARRVEAWAARLTRFDVGSDLSRLNAAVGAGVTVRPTLAAVLAWARRAQEASAGIVDSTMLRERLAAETDRPELSAATVSPTEDGAIRRDRADVRAARGHREERRRRAAARPARRARPGAAASPHDARAARAPGEPRARARAAPV